ncbi:MAG: hypothetical protein JXB49_37095 [Bacteroidales bacterium]|nr:hypothetical protein [Bacteroidales bacterium]
MAFSLADTYYMKAMDAYPYCVEETIENLQYALSYNNEHVGAICLMAKILSEKFKHYTLAESYFEKALMVDPYHFETCVCYAQQLIITFDFMKAEKLLKHAHSLKGVDLSQVYYLEGLMHEYQKDYAKAGELYGKAFENAYNADFILFIEECIARIKKKMDANSEIVYTVC